MQKMPFGMAVGWILLWTLLVSGSAVLGCLYYLHQRESQSNDDQYRVVAIVQTTSDKESLKTVYLAELLGLSVDQPTNLHRFDSDEAKQKLLNSHVIKDVEVKKVRPGTVYVEYCMRKPIAYSGDYTNTAFDSEGIFFPVSPFYTPKRLPEVRLGLMDRALWGSCCRDSKPFQLTLAILKAVESRFHLKPIHLKEIDVSRAYAPSYGQREIVMRIDEDVEREEKGRLLLTTYPRLLRCSVDHFDQALEEYLVLRGKLSDRQAAIIDLRIPQLAFIKDDN